MVESGATHFPDVLLHGEMCVQTSRRRNVIFLTELLTELWQLCHVCESTSSEDQAKLIFLLTGPIRVAGGIDWGFYQVHVDDLDEDGITSYKSVASVLNQLALLELRDSNSTVGTLQILETVFRTLSEWPVHSEATLLVLLHEMSCPLVADYFRILRNGHIEHIEEILTAVNFSDHMVEVDTLKSFILCGMESSYEPSEMKSMFLYCICAPLGVEEGSPLYEAIFAGDFPERWSVFHFHPHLKEIWIEKGFELF